MSHSSSSSEGSRLWSFLPLIIPLAVIVTFAWLYGRFLFCHSNDAHCNQLTSSVLRAAISNTNETRALRYVAKATWTLVNGTLVLACIAGLLTASVVIWQALSDYRRGVRRMVIVLVMAMAANVSLLIVLWANSDPGAPVPQLLRAVTDEGSMISIYNRRLDALSLTAALSLCFAASLILWKRDIKKVQSATELARRLKLLRYVLYTGATLLVINVLRLSATLNWGASFIPHDSDVGKAISILMSGVLSTLGTYYTFLMAGMYLPAALILWARGRELAKDQTLEKQDDWLKSRGLSLSYAAWLPRIIAILAPLMAGPFIDIIKKLVGTPPG